MARRSDRRKRARPRVVRRAVPIAILLALLAWLGARGFGGGQPAGGDPADPAAVGVGRGPGGAARDGGGAPAAPSVESAPAHELPKASGATDMALVDRLWSCLSTMADAEDAESFAVAFDAREAVRELALDAEQRVELADAARSLDERLVAHVRSAVDGAARSGEVLAAIDRLERLLDDGAALADRVREILRVDCRWPELGVREAPPQPPSLPRGTRVRLLVGGEHVVGSVAAGRGSEVTVRVQTASGLRFPTLPRVAIEPVGGEPMLAESQALAAEHAGLPLLAAAWRVRADALR